MQSNTNLGAYDVIEATVHRPAPVAGPTLQRIVADRLQGPLHQLPRPSSPQEIAGGCITMQQLHHFRQVWLADFEFSAQTGERPSPVVLWPVTLLRPTPPIFDRRTAADDSTAIFNRPRHAVCGVLRFSGVGLFPGTRLADAIPYSRLVLRV